MFSRNFKKSAEEFFKLGPRGSKKNQNIMLVVGACGVLFGFFQLKYALNMKRDLEKKNDHKHLADGTYVETA